MRNNIIFCNQTMPDVHMAANDIPLDSPPPPLTVNLSAENIHRARLDGSTHRARHVSTSGDDDKADDDNHGSRSPRKKEAIAEAVAAAAAADAQAAPETNYQSARRAPETRQTKHRFLALA